MWKNPPGMGDLESPWFQHPSCDRPSFDVPSGSRCSGSQEKGLEYCRARLGLYFGVQHGYTCVSTMTYDMESFLDQCTVAPSFQTSWFRIHGYLTNQRLWQAVSMMAENAMVPGSKVVSGAVDLAIFFESVVKVFFTEVA